LPREEPKVKHYTGGSENYTGHLAQYNFAKRRKPSGSTLPGGKG